ncbi:hybrid sensor histidine kinase/response regulator [Nocardioides sp. URHA0032]|uniref:hybrid sensor histidine kinase/response regulator n=1 Tax=Nocardioides sp. URHA0032 TaxID=1380388 RepID=UPI0012DF5369|nr:response regulator [Nocardioides sp. URHA0032]
MSRRTAVLGAFWAVELLLVAAHLADAFGTVGAWTYLIGVWLGPALAWYGTAAAPPGRRSVPALIAAGLTSSAVGDLIWQLLTWSSGEPDVSVADIPYLMSYLGLGAAILVVIAVRRGQLWRLDVDAVIDAATVVVVSVLLFWTFSIHDIVADQSVSALTRVVWAAYPVLDAVLLALVLRALSVRRSREAIGIPFAAGVGCWLVSDIGYLVLEVDGAVSAALDIGWMLGGLLMATSTLRGQAPPDDTPGDEAVEHPLRKLGIAIGPLLVPPLLLIADAVLSHDPKAIAVLVGMFALVGLAFVRTARLLQSEARVRAQLAAARDAALEGSRAKSAFLATMSHEIRTPMNGVIGLTDLLLTTDLDERQLQYAHGVQGAGRALLSIINDILDFSKVEAGRLDLEDIDFDLVQLVEEVAELVAEPAREKDLELLAYCSPEVPPALRGDPARLRQVLLNLAANAVKFTPAGEVVIRAQLESRNGDGVVVRLEVVDTGIGVPDEHRAHLFEPFSQADSSTTRQYGGTGLGLAISHQLVIAMGGEIGVSSTVGRGSTFWATVPLRTAEEPEGLARPTTEGLAGLRVLVVDDNHTNRVILHDQLSAWGMTVETVGGGDFALAVLKAAVLEGRRFDLGVLDLCMPGMDGLELGRRVAATPELAGTPLVLLTSGPDVGQGEALAAGIGASLTKPVALTRLRTTLAGLVAAPAPVSAPLPPSHAKGRGRVLVVEDGEINQLVAFGILESLGYEADVADDGYGALDALSRATYDAVLMDVQMPNLDGYAATAEIRKREGTARHTPIIAMTASAIEGDRERCLAAGMDDYVSKPVDRTAVDAVLGRWVPAR